MWRLNLLPVVVLLSLTACGRDGGTDEARAATAPTGTVIGRSAAPDVGGIRLVEAAEGSEPALVATVPSRVRGIPVRRCWIRGHEGAVGTGFRAGGILLPGASPDTALCAVALWQALRAAPDRDLDPGEYRLSANADGRDNGYVPDNPDWEPDDFREVTIDRSALQRAAAMLRRTVAFP